MPAVIDQHTIEIRIIWLDVEQRKLLEKQPMANDEEMAQIAEKLKEVEYRQAECRDWLRILNQDPGWGDLITVDGRKVPKMPTFKSKEEMDKRISEWGTAKGRDEAFLKRAREYRAQKDAREDVLFMDGIGPITQEEEDAEQIQVDTT